MIFPLMFVATPGADGSGWLRDAALLVVGGVATLVGAAALRRWQRATGRRFDGGDRQAWTLRRLQTALMQLHAITMEAYWLNPSIADVPHFRAIGELTAAAEQAKHERRDELLRAWER